MGESTAADDFRVFINYRRDDTAGYTGRLYDACAARFGERNVFIDIDKIDPGSDFVDAIADAIRDCGVLLLMIGPAWLRTIDGQGRRRIDDPGDYVRLEIEAAIEHRIRVIPVLVGGAPMPAVAELPESLSALARRNAFELSDRRWHTDVHELLDAIARVRTIGPDEPTLVGTTAVQVPAAAVSTTSPPARLRTRRNALVGAAALVVVAALIATLALRGSPKRTVALAVEDRTTTSSTAATATAGDTSTSAPADAATTVPTPAPAPQAASGGRRTTAGGTSSGTAAPQAGGPIDTTPGGNTASAPDPPQNPRASDPQNAGGTDPNDGGPTMVSLTFNWSAPAGDGGAAVIDYQLYRTDMTYDTPSGSRQLVRTVSGTSASFETPRSSPPGSWVKWEISARNSVGTSALAVVKAVVPDVVGLAEWDAAQHLRLVGAPYYPGDHVQCGRQNDYICSQETTPGSVVSAGTHVVTHAQG